MSSNRYITVEQAVREITVFCSEIECVEYGPVMNFIQKYFEIISKEQHGEYRSAVIKLLEKDFAWKMPYPSDLVRIDNERARIKRLIGEMKMVREANNVRLVRALKLPINYLEAAASERTYKAPETSNTEKAPTYQGLPKIARSPAFKREVIEDVVEILGSFFSKEDQGPLEELIRQGIEANEPLMFLDNGNRLADAFKQLINSDFITGCEKQELCTWIARNFKYRYRKETRYFSPRYLKDIIATHKDKCQKPLLNVKNGQIVKIH